MIFFCNSSSREQQYTQRAVELIMVDWPFEPTKMAAKNGTPPHKNLNNFFQNIDFDNIARIKCSQYTKEQSPLSRMPNT